MSKTFEQFRKPVLTEEINTESQEEFIEDYMEIDPAAFKDLALWLKAASEHEWDHFPSKEIEERLNGFGYTAYLDTDYLEDETDSEGAEVILIYQYSGGALMKNAVINVSWVYDDGCYDIDASIESVSQEELEELLDDEDAPIESEIDDLNTELTESAKAAEAYVAKYFIADKMHPDEFKEISDDLAGVVYQNYMEASKEERASFTQSELKAAIQKWVKKQNIKEESKSPSDIARKGMDDGLADNKNDDELKTDPYYKHSKNRGMKLRTDLAKLSKFKSQK